MGNVGKTCQKECYFKFLSISHLWICAYKEFKGFNIVCIHCCKYNMQLLQFCLGCGHN